MKRTLSRCIDSLLRTWLIVVSVFGLPFTAFVCALLVDMIQPLTAHAATTYYIDDDGNDAAAGTSTSVPWKTWSKAFGVATACGDTLIVMNGTYTVAVNGTPTISGRVCTASTIFTIKGQTQRGALIQGTGNVVVNNINSAYITWDGVRIKNVDNAGGAPDSNFRATDSTHIDLKNSIVSHNNRYANSHLVQYTRTSASLIEGNELYSFARHAVIINNNPAGAAGNVIRLNYCHSRDYADIAGGYVSGLTTAGDDCFLVYPGSNNVFENNIAEGAKLKGFAVEAISPGATGNKFYGNINMGGLIGMALDARGSTTLLMPQSTTIQDFVSIGTSIAGVRLNGTKTTTCTHCTATAGTGGSGFNTGIQNVGDGAYSFTATDLLTFNNTGTGVLLDLTGLTFTITDSNSNNNTTANYNPSSHASYDPSDTPSTADPQMGTCYLWPPDGSAAATNDWGTTILYRTVDGVTGIVPLWDPTTGEFPHGAIIAGVNDINGSSPYNVHERLHVGLAGCPFPASFLDSTTPQNPANYVSSEGVSSTSHEHTFTAGLDGALVAVHVRDSAGNVGSVSGVTGCTSEAYSLLKRQTSSVTNPFHAVEWWGKIGPATGTCTIAVSTTGAVTSTTTTSIAVADASAFGAVVGAGGLSVTPSVTVAPLNTGEIIYSATSGASSANMTAGAYQTLQVDSAQPPLSTTTPSRLAISEQSADDGGLVDYVFSSNTNWAAAAVAVVPAVPDPPATNELDVTKYGFFSGFGTEAGSAALAATNTAYNIAPTGMVRVRAEITAEVATTPPFGLSLYCRKNADSYTQVVDTFGSGVVRLYGAGIDEFLPSSLTPTTPRLTAPDGNSVAGAMIRDTASVFIAPQMASGKRIEMEWVIVLNAAVSDTIDCQPRFDSGVPFTTNTVTPRLNIVPPAASGISMLPEQPWGLTATPNPPLGPRPFRGTLASVERSSW